MGSSSAEFKSPNQELTSIDLSDYKIVALDHIYQNFENFILISLFSYSIIHRIALQNSSNNEKRYEQLNAIIAAIKMIRTQRESNELTNQDTLAAALLQILDRTRIATDKLPKFVSNLIEKSTLYKMIEVVCSQNNNNYLLNTYMPIKISLENVAEAAQLAFNNSSNNLTCEITVENLKKVILYSIIFFLIDGTNNKLSANLVEIIDIAIRKKHSNVEELLKDLDGLKDKDYSNKSDPLLRILTNVTKNMLQINTSLNSLLTKLKADGLVETVLALHAIHLSPTSPQNSNKTKLTFFTKPLSKTEQAQLKFVKLTKQYNCVGIHIPTLLCQLLNLSISLDQIINFSHEHFVIISNAYKLAKAKNEKDIDPLQKAIEVFKASEACKALLEPLNKNTKNEEQSRIVIV